MKPQLSNLFLDSSSNFYSSFIKIGQKVADNLNLVFVKENELHGNVCFANSPEVRADFREIITSSDLQNCIYALLHSSEYKQIDAKFPDMDLLYALIPIDNTEFWKLVKQGYELRSINPDSALEQSICI